MFGRYFRLLYVVGLKSAVLAVCVVVMALFFCLGLFFRWNQGGIYGAPLSRATYEEAYRQTAEAIGANVYEGASQRFLELKDAELEALRRAVDAETARDFYAAAADYRDIELEMATAGHLAGGTTTIAVEARLLRLLSQMPDPPAEYESSRSAPATYYVASVYRHVPYPVFLLPIVVASVRLTRLRCGRRLFARLPVAYPTSVCAFVCAVAAVSLTALVLAWTPAFVVTAVRNGVGGLLYPVVFRLGGEIVTDTVVGVIMKNLALYVAFALFFSLLAELVRQLSGNPWAAGAAVVVVAVLPMVPLYGDLVGRDAAYLVPTTYFEAHRVIGAASNLAGFDNSPGRGATFSTGLAVSLGYGGVLALLCAVAESVKSKARGSHTKVRASGTGR